MSVSVQLLDALKSSLGGVSDYSIARKIGVTQQAISQVRQNNVKLSIEKAIQICKLANLDAQKWILRLYAERAKSQDEIDLISDLQNRLAA